VVVVLPTVTTTDPVAAVFVNTKNSAEVPVPLFTATVADPLATVAADKVDSNSALVAVAETVVLLAIPETETLSALDTETVLSAGTGRAIAVAAVVPVF
jgi:hypothetical protein